MSKRTVTFVEEQVPSEMQCGLGPLFKCDPDFVNEWKQCKVTKSPWVGGRQLSSHEQKPNVFDVMGNNPHIPVLVVAVIGVLAALWVLVLRKFPHGMVWATVVLKLGVWFGMGAWFMSLGDGAKGHAILFFVLGGLFAAFAYWHRKKYHVAGDHLKLAMMGLVERMRLFFAAGIIEAFYLAYLGIFCFMCIQLQGVYVLNDDCTPVLASWTFKAMIYMDIQFMWTTFWFKNINLFVCSQTISDWYFGNGEISSPVSTSVKLALTASTGALTLGSAVSAACDKLLKEASKKTNLTNPWGCLLVLVVSCFRHLIEAMTKFAIIMHAISGMTFFNSGIAVFQIMKKHFFQGMITDSTGKFIVWLGAYVAGLVLGFATWKWADLAEGWDTFGTSTQDLHGGSMVFYVFLVLFFVLVAYPMFAIVLIAIISQFDFAHGAISAPFAAIFCGSVASIVFAFIGTVVMNSMDTIFVCYSIGKEKGAAHVEGRQEMYTLLDDVVTGIIVDKGSTSSAAVAPVVEATVVAVAPAATPVVVEGTLVTATPAAGAAVSAV